MRRPRSALVVLLAVVAMAGARCPSTIPPGDDVANQVNVELRFRRSCNGTNQQSYDTTCLSGLRMTIASPATSTPVVKCVALSPTERPANLQALVNSSTRYVSWGTYSDQGPVTLSVQGLHDVAFDDAGTSDPCARADDPATWLFFGESEPIPLDGFEDPDAGTTMEVLISVDCRDCVDGCATLGSASCPVLRESFCVPASDTLNCNKPCAGAEQCFEGALVCDVDSETCRHVPPPLLPEGELCAPCDAQEECSTEGAFACVGLTSATTGICAPSCPAQRCPNGAICKQLFHGIKKIGVAAPADAGPDDDDAGVNDAGANDAGALDAGDGGT